MDAAIRVAFARYRAALRERNALDFDDLVARALALLREDTRIRDRWRERCSTLLVDEAQDLDRSQLDLALILCEPARDVFLVGDDDQTIYAWRLADVRRILGLAAALPGLRRVDLETNYRCPAQVVARAVRLIEHGQEALRQGHPGGTEGGGRLVLAADPGTRWHGLAVCSTRGTAVKRVATRSWRGRTPSWRRSRPGHRARHSVPGGAGRAAA